MHLYVCLHTHPSAFCRRRLLGHRNDCCRHSWCFQRLPRCLDFRVHSAVPVSGKPHRQQWLWFMSTCTMQTPLRLSKFTDPGVCRAYDFSLFCFGCHVFSRASQPRGSQRSQQLRSAGHSRACSPSQPGPLWSAL